MDIAEVKRSLPVTVGKVQAIVAKRDEWTETDLNERRVVFGPVAFTYRDIISFSEVHLEYNFTQGALHVPALQHFLYSVSS
jgi:hypothetical protein